MKFGGEGWLLTDLEEAARRSLPRLCHYWIGC